MSVTIYVGDCIARMRDIPDASVSCCVTSPPYWGLRDYGVDGQIGLEETPSAYIERLVSVFREVRRCLRDDGTLWLNLGDSYASDTKGSGGPDSSSTLAGTPAGGNGQRMAPRRVAHGLKPKDLVGIPWRVAFALQADGWWLRSDIIWSKPNPMPESVTDRPTKAHEYLFLLAKSERYYFDAEAIAEASVMPAGTAGSWNGNRDFGLPGGVTRFGKPNLGGSIDGTRNARSVWEITTQPFSGAHFATMPPALAERCIRAGSAEGTTVLDPFGGAGTTALVAAKLGRHAAVTELNPDYARMAQRRIEDAVGLLCPAHLDEAQEEASGVVPSAVKSDAADAAEEST